MIDIEAIKSNVDELLTPNGSLHRNFNELVAEIELLQELVKDYSAAQEPVLEMFCLHCGALLKFNAESQYVLTSHKRRCPFRRAKEYFQ